MIGWMTFVRGPLAQYNSRQCNCKTTYGLFIIIILFHLCIYAHLKHISHIWLTSFNECFIGLGTVRQKETQCSGGTKTNGEGDSCHAIDGRAAIENCIVLCTLNCALRINHDENPLSQRPTQHTHTRARASQCAGRPPCHTHCIVLKIHFTKNCIEMRKFTVQIWARVRYTSSWCRLAVLLHFIARDDSFGSQTRYPHPRDWVKIVIGHWPLEWCESNTLGGRSPHRYPDSAWSTNCLASFDNNYNFPFSYWHFVWM